MLGIGEKLGNTVLYINKSCIHYWWSWMCHPSGRCCRQVRSFAMSSTGCLSLNGFSPLLLTVSSEPTVQPSALQLLRSLADLISVLAVCGDICATNKDQVWSMELSCCSPECLEHLASISNSRGQFRAGLINQAKTFVSRVYLLTYLLTRCKVCPGVDVVGAS